MAWRVFWPAAWGRRLGSMSLWLTMASEWFVLIFTLLLVALYAYGLIVALGNLLQP
jgi:hypothetical protein